MRWSALPLVGVVAAASLGALAPAAAAEPLGGRVVNNVSDAPVPAIGVLVRSVTQPSRFYAQQSDAAGRFLFPDVPAGLYTIRAVISNSPWTGFRTYLVPPGVPTGEVTGPIGLPLGMSSDVELRLTNPDSGGEGEPAPNFNGRLRVRVRRAVGRSDLTDADIFAAGTPLGWENVEGQTVRITRVLPTPADPFDRVTTSTGYVFVEDIAPPTAPDAPPVIWAFDVALVDGSGVAGAATRVSDDTPAWNVLLRRVAPPRFATLSGRVFVEPGVPDGTFDPSDQPLPGSMVRLFEGFDAGPGATPVAIASTDGEGRYRFTDVRDGFYVVETAGRDGPERRALDLVLLELPADPVVDFALTPQTCPHVPCGAGPLHEVVLDAELPVGDPTSFELAASLFDACAGSSVRDAVATSWAGAFPGPATGANGVLRVESVTVGDGLARVRLRLTAGGTAFPGGFFGSATRGVELTLNGATAGACVSLSCDATVAGTELPPLGRRRTHGAGRLRVVETWTYESWRRCTTPGPCPTQSATAEGGTNLIEVELPVVGHAVRGFSRRLDVVATVGGSVLDRVTVRFPGDAWDGAAVGGAGRLTALSVRRTGLRAWVVRVRLEAPDRLDGQPGALPARVVTLSARLGRGGGALALDLAAPPPPGPLFTPAGAFLGTVLRFTNAVDAGCDD